MIITIKDYSKIFESNSKYDGKDLIIVDVQEAFSKYIGDTYIEELNKFCENFNRVIQIWDSIDANKPDYDFPNQVIELEKQYGSELDKDYVELLFDKEEQESIYTKLEEIPDEGDSFMDNSGMMWLYVGAQHNGEHNGEHEWFSIDSELSDYLKELKAQRREIVLVGGADGECLYDIECALDLYEIPYETHDDLVYSFYGNVYLTESVINENSDLDSYLTTHFPNKRDITKNKNVLDYSQLTEVLSLIVDSDMVYSMCVFIDDKYKAYMTLYKGDVYNNNGLWTDNKDDLPTKLKSHDILKNGKFIIRKNIEYIPYDENDDPNFQLKEDIKEFVKNNNDTTLEYDDDIEDGLMFTTRENGDIGNEIASDIDIKDAIRLKHALNKQFPILSIDIEEVDEWVHLNIHLK